MASQTRDDFWTAQDSARAIDYYYMIRSVTDRLKLPVIEYPLKGIFGNKQFMSDHFHPNGEGYRRMAYNVAVALCATIRANGIFK